MKDHPNNPAPDLDDLLTTDEAAQWLKMSKRELLEKIKGRNPRIVCFGLNQRVLRFHPRTIISKMAADAGVKPETIAASFGLRLAP